MKVRLHRSLLFNYRFSIGKKIFIYYQTNRYRMENRNFSI